MINLLVTHRYFQRRHQKVRLEFLVVIRRVAMRKLFLALVVGALFSNAAFADWLGSPQYPRVSEHSSMTAQ